MAFKFKIQKNPVKIPLPPRPQIESDSEPEQLMGQVQGMKASAPEERLARALDKANLQYIFRYTVGAPRGLPGWKELDFVIMAHGLVYTQEVDTAFTHRDKAQSDILHDAIIQNDVELHSMGEMWPEVFHADGDTQLADNKSAENYVRQRFGK